MKNLGFEDGVMYSAAVLVASHDQPGMAAGIIKSAGLENYDCAHLDEFDKKNLKIINRENGMDLQCL